MIPIGDLIAIITTVGGSLAIIIKLLSMACFQSKCSRIKCCCIEVDRDVKIEQNQLNFEENHNNIQHHENKPQEVYISIDNHTAETSPKLQIRQLDKE
jgi:hypothetical protein